MADETVHTFENLSKTYPATPQEARATGAKFYFPRRPCIHGHLSPWYIPSVRCIACYRVWADKNRERLNAQSRNYQKRNGHYVRAKKLAFFNRIRQVRPWESLINGARSRAKAHGKEFNLTHEWAASVWTGRCAITGHPFDMIRRMRHGGFNYSPSIDRIDNSVGYTTDNCRFILFAVNIFKRAMSDEDMLKIADLLSTSFWASQLRQPPVTDQRARIQVVPSFEEFRAARRA